MAEKTTIDLKRVYNIPLRKEFLNAPRYKRAKKAITALKEFLSRHMRSDDVRLGKHLNMKIWERGIKNPPHHVQVNVTRNSEGIVNAELVGFEYNESKPEQASKKDRKKTVEDKVKETKVEAKAEKKESSETAKKGKKALKKELEDLKKQ